MAISGIRKHAIDWPVGGLGWTRKRPVGIGERPVEGAKPEVGQSC